MAPDREVRRTRTWRDWRYWRNLAVFTALAGVVGYFAFVYLGHSYYLAYGFAHPQRLAVCCETPAERGLPYEDIAFTTSDGLTLRGWYIASQNRAAVILLHEMASNRLATLDEAEMFARQGYGVLMMDIRTHGESDGTVLPFGGPEAEDVRAAAAYLRARTEVDPGRIGVMGFSLGAQVGLLGAALTPETGAVAADSPGATTFEDWPPARRLGDWLYVPYDLMFFNVYLKWHSGVAQPMSVREALGDIAPRPVFLLGGDHGRSGLEHLFAAAQEPKQLWIIPDTLHTEGLSTHPQEYEARVIGFFDEALLP